MHGLGRHALHLNLILPRPRFGQRPCRLHPHQRIGLDPKRLLETDRHLRRQTGIAVEQIDHRLARDMQPLGKLGDVEARRIDDLGAQPLAGVNREAVMKFDRQLDS